MIRSFLLEIPKEMLEAARIDGAGVFTELTRVILPIVLPGIAATALICVIFTWNEFFFAYFLTATKGQRNRAGIPQRLPIATRANTGPSCRRRQLSAACR
jgi:ABC-type glycerol-3-phosphate transport system permease component